MPKTRAFAYGAGLRHLDDADMTAHRPSLKQRASGGRALSELKIGRGNYCINLALNAVRQPQPA